MGKFDGKYLRGAVGDTVFKKVGGQQIVQGKPKKPNTDQSQKTKKAAAVFGKASNLAACIRVALNSVIGFYDGTMISRLTGEVNHICHSALDTRTQNFNFTTAAFSRLNGFEFNTISPVKNQFFVQPIIDPSGNIVQLPEIKIPKELKFPANGQNCVLGLQAALFDLKNGYFKPQKIQTLEIKYEFKPAIIPASQFIFQTEPGCLCIISIALQYFEKTFAGNSVVNNKTFNPSAILNAFMIDGTADTSITEKWQQMAFKTDNS